MKYSMVFLGAFLAATSLDLPAPAAAPNTQSSSADTLALRDTSVQGPEGKNIVRKAAKPTNLANKTDTDGEATDSDQSATDGASDLSDTTDDGNRRKPNRRALAVRRQLRRNARAVAKTRRDDANETDTDGADSSPSDDDDSESDGEKKRHMTRALRLRKARRYARSAGSRDLQQRNNDTTDDEHTSAGRLTDSDGVSTAPENTTDNDGIDTSDDSD